MTTDADKDPALTATFWAVGCAGALTALIAGLHFDARAALGVAVGAAAALGNLWGIARLVRVYLYSDGKGWATLALFKLAILVGVIFELLHFDVVTILPVVVGYGALPVGIVVARLRPAPHPLREER